jgi:MFS family permease
MRALLRNREARIFLFGWTLSQFGDWAMFFVLAIWAKDLTHSNSAAGLIFFALALPGLFSPFAGLVVDRLPRKRVMMWTYAIEAVVLLSLLFVHDRGDIWILYAVTAFYGTAGNFAASARNAFMTIIVPREQLGDANGIFQTTREGLRLIAPLTGAALYAAVGGGAVSLLDSASFVAVVVALLFIRVAEPKFERQEQHFVTELLAGARHMFWTPALRQIIGTSALAFLVVGFSETTIFAVLQYGLHRPASFFGVLGSAQGAGAIAGGIFSGALLRRIGDVKLVGLGMAAFAFGDLTFVSSNLPLIVVGIAAAGAGVAWFVVGLITAVQLRTPARLQGRVSSAADVFVNTPQTISIALGAALITIVDYRILVVAEGFVIALCGAYLATRQAVAGPDLPELAPEGAD